MRVSHFRGSLQRACFWRSLGWEICLFSCRVFIGATSLSTHAGNGLPFVSSPKGSSDSPTANAKDVKDTGIPRVPKCRIPAPGTISERHDSTPRMSPWGCLCLLKAIEAFVPRRSSASGWSPFILVHRASLCAAKFQKAQSICFSAPNNACGAFDVTPDCGWRNPNLVCKERRSTSSEALGN
jgi:hypothetical protein